MLSRDERHEIEDKIAELKAKLDDNYYEEFFSDAKKAEEKYLGKCYKKGDKFYRIISVYKQFKINTLEDACIALKGIIVPAIVDLQKFENYSTEAEELLKSYSPGSAIPANIYDSLHDKTIYQQRELLRLMADHQSSSFSYIEIRKLFEKKGFLKRNLSEKSRKTLNELLDLRNWSFCAFVLIQFLPSAFDS